MQHRNVTPVLIVYKEISTQINPFTSSMAHKYLVSATLAISLRCLVGFPTAKSIIHICQIGIVLHFELT